MVLWKPLVVLVKGSGGVRKAADHRLFLSHLGNLDHRTAHLFKHLHVSHGLATGNQRTLFIVAAEKLHRRLRLFQHYGRGSLNWQQIASHP